MEGFRSEKNKTEDTPEQDIASVLETVDFDGLAQIFTEKFKNLGLDAEQLTFVPRERVSDIDWLGKIRMLGGKYLSDKKEIQLNESVIGLFKSLSRLDPEAPTFKNVVVSTLCHEETHAVSHQSCGEWSSTVVPFVEKRNENVGYMQKPANRILGNVTVYPPAGFVLFNEGVTDMIGEEVYKNYVTRQEQTDERVEEYFATYAKGRLLTKAVIEKIATECELSTEEIWRAIQRGYFAGENLKGDTMQRLFNQIAPASLFENIESADGPLSIDVPLALRRIKKSNWDDTSRTRVRRWFKHLDTLMSVTEDQTNEE